jgi:uncharacterized protein
MTEQVQSYPAARDHSLTTLCHLLGLAGLTGIPFANVLGPLILWLWKRETDPEVDVHGKESLNFQISMSIYAILAGLSMFVLIGFILLPAVLVADLVFMVIAAVKASRGEFYRYPLTIRFIS